MHELFALDIKQLVNKQTQTQQTVLSLFDFFRIHAITVCDNKKYFTDHINGALNDVGLGSCVSADDIIDIVDGYKGLGYGISTPEELGW